MDGINETLAQAIYQAGYFNVRQVADAQLENLQKIPGYETAEAAKRLKDAAAGVVEKAGDVLAGPASADDGKGSFTAAPVGNDAKAQAEKRLREMLNKDAGSSSSES